MAADAGHARDVGRKARIFISYSRKDVTFADRLEASLKARSFEPLIDRTEIYAFEDWWKRIEGLIGRADTVVFVLSPDAIASDIALKELAYAASLNKRFAPIVYRRVEDGGVPEPLRRLNFIFFDDPARFEASADALADALQTDISWIRRHTEFGEAARQWVDAGRANGLLLRPPALDRAEAWIAYRPHGAPSPTSQTETFVAESRKAEVATRRRNRILHAALYTLLVGVIAGLVGWINQEYIKQQWRWYTVERPFAAANIWPYVLKPINEQALKPDASNSFRECSPKREGEDYCPDMVVVPPGSFVMGSSPNEKGRFDNEGPQHSVTIARQIGLSKFALTFDEWDTCVAYGDCPESVSDAGFGRGHRPVLNVSWEDAQHYALWLSKMTGKPYRLLSEAEYEYATRAGSTTAYPWGDDIGKNNANCLGCGGQWDGQQTAPVGSYAPNAFGLYDMVGNVSEWVEDCGPRNTYDGAPVDGSAWIEHGNCDLRIIRGGAWGFSPPQLRSADRMASPAGSRIPAVGFRVARTLDTR